MSEPTTEAGRALLELRATHRPNTLVVRDLILAIEEEARAGALDAVQARVTALSKTSYRDGSPSGSMTVVWTDALAAIEAARK